MCQVSNTGSFLVVSFHRQDRREPNTCELPCSILLGPSSLRGQQDWESRRRWVYSLGVGEAWWMACSLWSLLLISKDSSMSEGNPPTSPVLLTFSYHRVVVAYFWTGLKLVIYFFDSSIRSKRKEKNCNIFFFSKLLVTKKIDGVGPVDNRPSTN